MGNGGMIQTQRRDGTWKDAFPVGYKPINAMWNVSNKNKRPARVINKKGEVLFSTEDDT